MLCRDRTVRPGHEEAGDRAEATAPGPGPPSLGLSPSGSEDSKSNGRNLLRQTDSFNSSHWGSAGCIPIIPFHGFLTIYLFQEPTNRECFFFSFHRVVLAGAFVPHPNMCCSSQKWRFITPSWQTASSTENEFYLFSETNLSFDILC